MSIEVEMTSEENFLDRVNKYRTFEQQKYEKDIQTLKNKNGI